ncbi:MAG: extracellular solute-binding protein, partial [Clostridia bacterium]|nr:extracellular solute-binding protein [Clostridia bacterium]
RELLVVIGSSPDKYRDYDLDTLLPDTLSNLKAQRDNLEKVLNEIYEITGQKGSNLSIFSTIINQLDEFIGDDEKIPSGFSYFKTNIGSFGTWITTALQQPLDLDYIVVSSENTKLPKANVNLFKKFTSWLTSFVASFIVDYDSIGNLSENKSKPITVWMTSGRDQMQILKVLIQNSFIQKTGINVQLENVEAGAILKAIAAGNGPDALIGAGMADPVNYALRNAALNLNEFKDIEDVKSRFYSETLVPFSFGGGLYALPEVLSFKVMFYRTDIMNEMKLEVPETWDDVTIVTSTLQKNNMTFGLPAPDIIGTYATFLYQMGGELYNKDGSKCLLTKAVNTDAFEIMSNYYENYALELSYNLVNRFRTGEMPIAIDDISIYNNLKVSAPEIEGLWGISLLPGTRKKDGTIDRTGYVGSTAAMVLGSSDMPKEAYEFIKWWTTKEVQSDYGKELESILGPSSRYLTANREDFENLPWNEAELRVIDEQLSKSRAVPQVPGSYYLTRHLNNAFRAVVISGEDLRDTLSEYNETINEELRTKRKEFNLN